MKRGINTMTTPLEEKLTPKTRAILAIILAIIAIIIVAANYNPIPKPIPPGEQLNTTNTTTPETGKGAGIETASFLILLGVILVYYSLIRGRDEKHY